MRGSRQHRRQRPLVFDDDALMLHAARDGAGLAYVYAADACADIAAGRLACVLQRCLPPPSRYFLYYPSRRQMPDIDVDFDSRRRDEVIAYIYDRFGHDHVGDGGHVNTMTARSAVRTAAKRSAIRPMRWTRSRATCRG